MPILSGYFLFLFVYDQITTSQKPEEIYSQRKSPDSPGGFRFKKTKRINRRALPEISLTESF